MQAVTGVTLRDIPRLFSPALTFRTMLATATAATNRDEVIERCRRAVAEIRSLGVRRIALFGSMARGEADADSDVDLRVEFEPGGKTFDRFLALSDLPARLLGRGVDLVTTEALSPYIGPHILAEAEDVVRAAWVSAAHPRRGRLLGRANGCAQATFSKWRCHAPVGIPTRQRCMSA